MSMLIVEIMASDLLGRADWSDPDFPAFARILKKLSHDYLMSDGQKDVNVKAITLTPIFAKDVPWSNPQDVGEMSEFISID